MKSCLMCTNFYTEASTWYSDETGGDQYLIGCRKNHFDMTFEPSEEDFRKIAVMAEACKDFQP